MTARDPLAVKQARAQELERLIDQAPDEATAGPLAAELHAIMDELDNVAELHPLPWVDTPADGQHHVTDAHGVTVYSGPDSRRVTDLQQWATRRRRR